MTNFKEGDTVRILGTGSTVHDFDPGDNKRHHGCKRGETRIIIGIRDYGGEATKYDPRYYGHDFNVRGHELELVKRPEEVINNYEIY